MFEKLIFKKKSFENFKETCFTNLDITTTY